MNNRVTIWKHLSAAPHRSLFLAGAFQAVLTVLWWVVELAGRAGVTENGGISTITPVWAHGFLMVYTFFPFFVLGFLFTTFPNWMNGEKIRANQYMTVCLLLVSGVVLFYAGLTAGKFLVSAGLLLMLTGWALAVTALFRVLFSAPAGDKRHAWIAGTAFIAGWLGLCAYTLWVLTDSRDMLDFSRQAGIWFFMLPILLTVSHRMIPFFSSRVLENYVVVRPFWLLWLMVGCAVAHGVLQLADLQGYAWWPDLLLACCALYLSYTWQFFRSFRVRLLTVLHISFAWLGIAMLFFGLQGMLFWLGGGEHYQFGLAPLHMLVVGYFASMVLGMASRVTLGHGGFPLVLDHLTWLLFIAFQIVVLLRVIPDIFPAAAPLAPKFYLAAGGIWLSCFLLWAIRFAPIYWRARVDGKAG
ncbi:NnrS family protein [Nitrosomonas sp.]|uniref:NnrS family protein n=1 Tax=Nitrosomonas sp. TaxID=42353 RepID=UPI0025D660A3|nr:NnrS family protein [Nitrosomonas sp.]MCC6916172.1 NnrS family protein [Nitrosomonas sp.]